MSETRSLGIQCESSKSTAVQTKRLSKEELRYYTKIVEKEKQVLLNFIKATKEYPALRQPHYRVNLLPTQTKVRKNYGTRKKRKNKNSKHKTKGKEVDNGDQENTGHYVSKIVVDDATHCLKLRVRSCNPKKSQELKENNSAVPPERARSRKAKQPRRYNRSLESLTEMENMNGDLNEEPLSPSQQPLKQNRETASPKEIMKPESSIINDNDINNNLSPPSRTTLKPISVKAEDENTDCLFANKKSHDHHLSPDSSPLPTMTSPFAPVPQDEDSPDRQTTSSDSDYHSPNEDSDDNQSVCSEEFFIVETHEDKPDDGKEPPAMNGETTEQSKRDDTANKSDIEQTDINLKTELKKRLKANLSRKSVDDNQYENINTENGKHAAANETTTSRNEPKALPQVVSVHFYDLQTHSQRVIGADTHIPYPTYPMVRDPPTTLPYPKSPSTTLPYSKSPSTTLPYPKSPSTTLPYPKSPSTTLPYPKSPSTILPYTKSPSTTPPYTKSLSTTLPYPTSLSTTLPYPIVSSHRAQKPPSATLTSRPPNLPQATLPRIPLMNYPYPPYYTNANEIHKQHPAHQIPSIPPSTKVRTLPPDISGNSITTRGVYNGTIPTQVSPRHLESLTNGITTRGVASPNATTEVRSHPPETVTNGITAREGSTPTAGIPTDVRSHHPELSSNNSTSRGVAPTNPTSPKETENSEITELDIQGRKRKRFIFGSHEPPKKKVISSLLTPLCEREATRLADGIHEINMQYFPLRSLAQKAANRVSGDTDDVLKLIEQKIQLKTKIQDVEKARNLLKDIYDMVLKSKEIEDIQNFELVSHNFGVRNILNHLSLVDLYFGELGTELQSKI